MKKFNLRSAFLFTFYVCFPITGFAQIAATITDNQVVFTVTPPTVYTSSGQVTYKYFWNFGDSHFKYSDAANPTVTHIYNSSYGTSFTPYVYYLPASGYDDTDDPPTGKYTQTVNLTTFSYTPTMLDYMGNATGAKLRASSKPVPDDEFIVIISYDRCKDSIYNSANGFITLNYDGSNFTYESFEAYASEVVAGSTSSSVQWSYSGLGTNEVRNIFVLFKVAGDAMINEDVSFDVVINSPSIDSAQCNSTNGSSMDLSIAKSHDPNAESINFETICHCNYSRESMEAGTFIDNTCQDYFKTLRFRIDFENNGNGPASYVGLNDFIDPALDFCSAGGNQVSHTSNIPSDEPQKLIPSFQGQNSLSDHVYVLYSPDNTTNPPCPENGMLKWNFESSDSEPTFLRGTAEPNFNRKYFLADAQGWAEYDMDIKEMPPPCSAIMHQAEITFDCNFPMKTNIAMARVGCNVNRLCRDYNSKEDIEIICEPCNEIVENLDPITIQSGHATDLYSAEEVADIELKHTYFKWHPFIENSPNHTFFNPQVAPATTTDYVLVASNAQTCLRTIYKRKVIVTCDFTLSCTPTYLGCTSSDIQKGEIMASVVGGEGPFTWSYVCEGDDIYCQGSEQNKDCVEFKNLSMGTYWIAVKDSKGCIVEQQVVLEAPYDPLLVGDSPDDCKANLIVKGGASPYSYHWNYIKSGNAEEAYSANISLKDVTEATVIVTDSDGCTYSFSPQLPVGNCKVFPNWYALGAAIFVLLIGGYLIFGRNARKGGRKLTG